jgi:hypothetical protein
MQLMPPQGRKASREGESVLGLRRIDHRGSSRRRISTRRLRAGVSSSASTESFRDESRALLRCGYEPYSLELIAGAGPGFDHQAFELAEGDAGRGRVTSRAPGRCRTTDGDALRLADPDGNGVELVPARESEESGPTWPARPTELPGFRPRKLGHTNFLTGDSERRRASIRRCSECGSPTASATRGSGST